MRIVCDASKSGIRAVRQQKDESAWQPIHIPSRFRTPLDDTHSINEFELP